MLAYLRSACARLFRRSEIAEEMEEELRGHLELRARDLERSGMERAEAQRRARVEFGGYVRFREESFASMGLPGGRLVETLAQDVRFAARVLRKSPGFTVAAVVTLALAIGANAVVFSVLNAFLLRPLNVPHAESLYALWRLNDNDMEESYPDYLDLRDRNKSFDGLVAYNVTQGGLDTGGEPTRAWIEEASGNYFDAMQLQPYLGKFFHASDEHGPNSAPYIVLTYAYWHSHFQEDRGVIGRVVRLNKHPFTVIGVGPPEFHGTILFFDPDFFVPIVDHPMLGDADLNAREDRWVFLTMGHLKPGVTPAQAVGDLNSIAAYLGKTYPKVDDKLRFKLASPSLYGDYLGKPVREFMTALTVLAALILLAACANLGSLFAARAADRSREVALRLALGASRNRILRGLLTEALLISVLGGAVGLAGSVMLLRALSNWQPFARWPIHLSVNPDADVYALAVMLAIVSGLLFGLVPVRQVLRTNAYEVIKAGAGPAARMGRRVTLRDVLLVVQIAICSVLVTSSMVAVRGLTRSLDQNLGFDLQNTMLVSAELSMAAYSGDRVAPMQKRMVEALQAIPGVAAAGLTDQLPMGDTSGETIVYADTAADFRPANAAAEPVTYRISPEYFAAAHTAIVAGRTFTAHDDKNSPRVAVVNREFARKVFGEENRAIGSYFKMEDGTRIEVVGLAENGKYASLTEEPKAALFLPILQAPSSQTYLVVRSSRDPVALGVEIRKALHDLDGALPVFLQTRYQSMDTFLFAPRMATITLGVMGLMGAMLSVTGIFGMAAYSVSKRMRELGIRVALGAQRREVLQAALGRAVKLLGVGSAAGLGLGILASRVLAFVVAHATPRDPLVLAGVVMAMLLLGLIATWIPARRALSVDPMMLLREE
jgi:predicted permease